MQDLIRQLLVQLGEDPDREGLRDTPKRMASSLSFLTHGYQIDPADIIKDAIFAEECNHMVIVRNIELYSLCEHHMLTFFGS